MTDYEIERSYVHAKNKKEQIRILADLNACKVEDIASILIGRGIDITGKKNKNVENTKSDKLKNSQKADKTRVEFSKTAKVLNKELPRAVQEALEMKLDDLESRMKNLRSEFVAIESEYSAIAQYLINPFGISQV